MRLCHQSTATPRENYFESDQRLDSDEISGNLIVENHVLYNVDQDQIMSQNMPIEAP